MRTPKAKRADPAGRILKTGEQYRKKDQRYLFRYNDGVKDRQIYAASLSELREKEKHIQRDLLDGIRTAEAEETTLNMLFDLLIEKKSRETRPNTVENYKTIWASCVKNRIGNKPISSIRKSTLEKLFMELADENRAKSCINLARKLVNTCFEWAVDDDLLRKNPCKTIKSVPGTVKQVNALTKAQQAALLDYTKNSVYSIHFPFLQFALATGLRCGELAALQWSDIDTEKGYVYITKQLQDLGKDGKREKHVTEPKTAAAVRKIPIGLDPGITHALTEQKKIYVRLGVRCTQTVDGLNDFVFLTVNGLPYNHNQVFTFLRRLIDAYNRDEITAAKKEKREPELLPRVSAHVLRHSCITNWVNAKMNPKTVQRLSGHEHVQLSHDVYASSDEETVKRDCEEYARSLQKTDRLAI